MCYMGIPLFITNNLIICNMVAIILLQVKIYFTCLAGEVNSLCTSFSMNNKIPVFGIRATICTTLFAAKVASQ